jgi:hypothetical protein
MKALTEQHLKTLERAEIEEYVQSIVKDLEELSLDWAFPSKREEYHRFAHIAYKKSLKYGLETEKDCHAFTIAWHTLGNKMIQTKWLMDIINNNDNYAWEKREALLCACYEKLDEMEGYDENNR